MNQLNGIVKAAVILTLVLSISACTQTKPYQQGAPATGCESSSGDSCAGTYYREYNDYDLGIVEISERGNAFDTARLEQTLSTIESKARNEGVITVVFVHGWFNNASEANGNFDDFKAVLQRLADDMKTFGNDRRVVGMYVGWRGASVANWLRGVRMATFWNRKKIAENLGSGSITRLLLELDRIKRVERTEKNLAPSKQNILITVGHSFGGAIVLSAIKDVLTGRLIATKGSDSPVEGVGDEVVLLNPAIEANQALTLVDVARGRSYSKAQSTILTVISSDEDWATHMAFPAGQLFGTLALHKQVDLDRAWYVHRDERTQLALREEDLDGITVGNFAPFLTHRVTLGRVKEEDEQCYVFSVSLCAETPHVCKAKGWNRTASIESINELPPQYPLRFIKTDKSIIRGHSDIFGDKVSGLLRGLIESRLISKPWEDSKDEWETTCYR